MFRTLLLFGLLCGAAARADKVDDYVDLEMHYHHEPGLAVAVTKSGRIVKLAGYGLANVEQNVPVTPETVFQIQSVTKQFVASAIMLLVEESKVALDAPVSNYLEGTPETWSKITVRHLLNQTSGIKDFINEPTASLRLEVSAEDVFKSLTVRPLNFAPGERYAYSNSNYHLLAMIIHKVTGQSYGDFLKRRVFQPLGMTQTRVMSWTDLIPHRAAGYSWNGRGLANGEFVAASILAYGGGGLLSTIQDMAKWDLGLRAEKVLPRRLLDQMWSQSKLNSGEFSSYGFGWGIGGEAPHRYVQHSGGHITGFTSDIIRYLDDDLSVIVLVNAGFVNPNRVSRTIAGFYVPELKTPERKAIEDNDPAAAELLGRILRMLRTRQLDDSVFTPPMREAAAASLEEAAGILEYCSALRGTELLERTNESSGGRRSLFRLRFERASVLVTIVLDKDGKVAGLAQELE